MKLQSVFNVYKTNILNMCVPLLLPFLLPSLLPSLIPSLLHFLYPSLEAIHTGLDQQGGWTYMREGNRGGTDIQGDTDKEETDRRWSF